MSLLKTTWRLFAAATLVVTCSAVKAEVYHPFADPMEFDPDWQFFAPVDVDSLMEMSPRKRAHTGWFGTYDRTYLWMSRANVEASAGTGDFGWGNRYDVGFMRDNDSGWLASFRHIGGPNVYNTIYTERLNRVNTADTDPIVTPVQPFLDANLLQQGTRAYLLADSLNVAAMSNFEINKTWRRSPYRYGGILEPMIGFKYTTFDDTAVNQDYQRSLNLISQPGTITTDFQVESLISQETIVKNQMVGGQFGARYFTHLDRWTVSGDLRVFSLANFQSMEFRQKTFTTEYGGAPGINTAVTATEYTETAPQRVTNSEFAFGFEARAEAAYQVTKYISLRGGIDVIDLAGGIWRGANPFGGGNRFDHNQDVQLAGYTFGIEINR